MRVWWGGVSVYVCVGGGVDGEMVRVGRVQAVLGLIFELPESVSLGWLAGRVWEEREAVGGR